MATSLLTWVEARAGLARRRRAGEVSLTEHRRAVADLQGDWEHFLRLDVTDDLVHEAATLAETHRLRAYDAVHLASALDLRARVGGEVAFASWDTSLDTAASREGLVVLRRHRSSGPTDAPAGR